MTTAPDRADYLIAAVGALIAPMQPPLSSIEQRPQGLTVVLGVIVGDDHRRE
jgi:hypothetical protein